MKCKPWKGQQTTYAHVKRDGHWLEVYKDTHGRVTCETSLPIDITEQLRYTGFYSVVLRNVPRRTRLWGELWMPGKPASYVKTAIKNEEPLYFDVFAIPSFRKSTSLERIRDFCEQCGLRSIPFHRADGPIPFEHLVTEALSTNVEGYVFKDGNRLNWYKWKPVKTIDLIVMDFKDGQGKYLGLVGALVCETAEGHVVANVSGMDDMTRAEISDDLEMHVGRICEVRYQYVGAKGRLRHPAFVRWRDDKTIDGCGINQDPQLEAYYANT